MSDQPLNPAVIQSSLGQGVHAALDPDGHLEGAVRQPGFLFAGIVAGAFALVGMLTFLLGTKLGFEIWPSFSSVLRELIALILEAAVMAAVVFAIVNVVLKRPEVKPESAANAVAIALVGRIAADVVLFIAAVIHGRLLALLSPLEVLVPMGLLVLAVQRGLGGSLRASLWTAVAAVLAGGIIHSLVVGTGGSPAAQTLEAINQLQQAWGAVPR